MQETLKKEQTSFWMNTKWCLQQVIHMLSHLTHDIKKILVFLCEINYLQNKPINQYYIPPCLAEGRYKRKKIFNAMPKNINVCVGLYYSKYHFTA